MVKRKKTCSTSEELENMTPGSREGIGVDGKPNPSRRLEGCDEEESGEQASDERSTKGEERVEILNPSATGPSSGPAPVLPGSPPDRTGTGSNQQPQSSAESTPPCHDQHHFLRSSVRPPSKRIRKDSIGSTINGHGGAKSKAENGSSSHGAVGQSVASSTGGVSKTPKGGQGPAEKEEQGGNQKRARRQWESWSAEDKNSFFEGLYEHGKDFEAIQNNIAMKYKKRGKPANMVKNKEQVRHFYYRTWHKISKHIDFANYSRVLKKSSQELYGLICYAELRKKVGGMDEKNVAKLNELIQQATTVRSKGRNLRIKAPMCRALKKLCDPDVSDEEDQKPVRLPLKVAVELQPRSNHSWARVQSLAYNPRLMVVELHRKVSCLIEYLKQKWAYQDQRILKSLMEREALEGGSSSSPDSPNKAQQQELTLFPAESSTLTTLPGVARVVHSKASCTVHWLESGKSRPNAKELPAVQILGIQSAPPPRGGNKSGRGGSTAAAANASMAIQADARRTEAPNPEPSPDGSGKAPEVCSTATSPLKAGPDEQNQTLTPPGKSPVAGVRSPSFGRQGRNLPRSLLGSPGDGEGSVFAVPTTLPPNSSRHSRMFSPNKEAQLAFRQQLDSISSDLFLSRQRKPRNRQLRKPLVVQRTLLPRTTGDTPQHVCSFSILSNSSATTGSFRPINTRLAPTSRPPMTKTSPPASSSAAPSQLSAIDLAAKSAGIIPGSPCRDLDSLAVNAAVLAATPIQNGLPPPSPGGAGSGDSLLSPPSVASLLDISLPGPPEEALTPGEPQTHISDSIIELAINSTNYEEAALSPAKLGNGDPSKLLASSPSVSPSRGWIPSPSHDPQWYPSDSSDSTLGCLLSMVSPDKSRRTTLTPSGPSSGTALLGPSLLDCNSHDSFQSRGLPDVAEQMDTQLACMMSESSVDYIARFNDLAQELAVTEPSI
uniref:Protein cramped-like n=1 Tax=Poecilia latipinna TaxID=48699 RepID=A0A3B3UNJ5_9TELE